MTDSAHWDQVYREGDASRRSWFRPHLEHALRRIEHALPDRDAPLIDVGGGESTLVDDLLERGYRHLTVLDLSARAIANSRQRLGASANRVEWRVDDITRIQLPASHYRLWHDRAVFHFLLEPGQRAAYVERLHRALANHGHLIIAVFGPDGPSRCSGLPVRRYDLDRLTTELGTGLRCLHHEFQTHHTPGGMPQQFLHAHFQTVS